MIIINLALFLSHPHAITAQPSLNPPNLAPPVLGWNSWNAYGGQVTEHHIRKAANDLVALGLQDAGYTYINIDDGWSERYRDPDGNLHANDNRFPSGIPSLVEYVNGRGLKLGIYADSGQYTCEGYPGSRGFEVKDAQLFVNEWGIEYLKYDNCFASVTDPVVDRYKAMKSALDLAATAQRNSTSTNKNARPRKIVYSLCEWGVEAPWLWASGPEVGADSWRTTPDIQPAWTSILYNLDASIGLSRFASPGHWNDLDMLEIGNGGLHSGQARAHMALWALLKSPLLIGTDLSKLTPSSLALLKSKELIAIHQDPLGVAGDLIWKQGAREVYACPLSGGDRAVVLFNRHLLLDSSSSSNSSAAKPTIISVAWKELGWPATVNATVRDVLQQRDITFRGGGRVVRGHYGAVVPPNDVHVVRISPVNVREEAPDSEAWRPWFDQKMFDDHGDVGVSDAHVAHDTHGMGVGVGKKPRVKRGRGGSLMMSSVQQGGGGDEGMRAVEAEL